MALSFRSHAGTAKGRSEGSLPVIAETYPRYRSPGERGFIGLLRDGPQANPRPAAMSLPSGRIDSRIRQLCLHGAAQQVEQDEDSLIRGHSVETSYKVGERAGGNSHRVAVLDPSDLSVVPKGTVLLVRLEFLDQTLGHLGWPVALAHQIADPDRREDRTPLLLQPSLP